MSQNDKYAFFAVNKRFSIGQEIRYPCSRPDIIVEFIEVHKIWIASRKLIIDELLSFNEFAFFNELYSNVYDKIIAFEIFRPGTCNEFYITKNNETIYKHKDL